MKEAGLKPQDLGLLAVSRGPGSFTGIRIGVTTIRALGLALNIPVVGVSTLQVLAHNFTSGLLCPVLNARRGQVYTALYRAGCGVPETVIPGQALEAGALMEVLVSYKEPVTFCGDGVEVIRAVARERLADPRFAPLHQVINRGGSLADLALEAWRRGEAVPADQLTPLYLRDSQAEVQLRAKGATDAC
jgi:tRNA threonylcarbamoyladenosine biosynthesis protein TsaB